MQRVTDVLGERSAHDKVEAFIFVKAAEGMGLGRPFALAEVYVFDPGNLTQDRLLSAQVRLVDNYAMPSSTLF